LNSLDKYDVVKRGDILVLEPHNLLQPVYEVLINGKGLPKRVIIKQMGSGIIVDYVSIKVETQT